MKTTLQLIFAFILIFQLTSCQKNAQKDVTSSKEISIKKEAKKIVIDTLIVSDDEFGVGCMTEYHKKGSGDRDKIFMQGGSKDDKGWVSFMMINGKKETFISQNEATESNADGTAFTMKLENNNYSIEIKAKIGDINSHSDSAEAKGTIKVTDKTDKNTTVIEFEGWTVC